MWNSTRRLLRRPSSVSFVSTGPAGPTPTLLIRVAAMPCATSPGRTEAARPSLSLRL